MVFEKPIPWMRHSRVVVERIDTIDARRFNLIVLMGVTNVERRTIGTFEKGEIKWIKKDIPVIESLLSQSERLCFEILPRDAHNSQTFRFSEVLKDPLWQEVLDSMEVRDLMES